MPKANVAQLSFSAGEVSPLLRGRADTAKYATGLEIAENFIVTPQGAALRRPGTKFLGNCKTLSVKNRIIPFRFSNTDNYVLEFGQGYIRIWRHEVTLNQVANTYAATSALTVPFAATHTIVIGAGHAYNAQTVTAYLSGFVGCVELNARLESITGLNGTDFSIPVPQKNFYLSGGTIEVLGGTPIEVATPYSLYDLETLTFQQSADVLYICHADYAPRKLSRTSAISWTLGTIDNFDGPYMPVDTRDIRMTLAGVTDTATMIWEPAHGADPFVAGDVNKYVEFQDRGVWKLAKITAFTNAATVTVDIADNTLVDLDPSIRLAAKSSGDSRSMPNATTNGIIFNKGSSGNWGPPTGYGSTNRNATTVREGVDPGAAITESGTKVLSSHSGTFSRYDVGKFVRIGAKNWRKITSLNSDKEVVADAALTFMAASPATDGLVITANSRVIAGLVTAYSAVFAATDVNRHLRLNFNSIWVWMKITGYTSATVVSVKLYDEPPTEPTDNTKVINRGRTMVWRLGAWSDTTGWPRTVCFHEQRLWFGGSKSEPHTLWGSRSGDFENFSPTEPDSTVLDDNGITYTLASQEVNGIMWLISHTVMLIGTVGGEWQMRAASSVQEPITPTNIAITPQTSYGSIDFAAPVKIGSAIIFIQRSGTKLVELSYSFELDSWQGRDLTVASEHILKGSAGTAVAKELAWATEPHNLLWVRLSDSTLACCTYNKDQEVLAWHTHYFNHGTVDSICALPAPDNSTTRLYLAFVRMVTPVDTRMIERISVDDTHYSDSYVEVNLTGVTQVTGVPLRLQFITLDVNATLYTYVGEFVPVTSFFNLGGTFDVLYYGIAYDAQIKTLPPEGGSLFGTAQGKMKRAARVAVRVHASSSIFHGKIANATNRIDFATNPFTGDHAFVADQGYSLENGYYLTQVRSLPLNILAWLPQVYTNE